VQTIILIILGLFIHKFEFKVGALECFFNLFVSKNCNHFFPENCNAFCQILTSKTYDMFTFIKTLGLKLFLRKEIFPLGLFWSNREKYCAYLLGFILLVIGCKTTFKAMDIVSPNVDDNFLLKNPQWNVATATNPSTPPFPQSFCPCGSGNTDKWTAATNCTTQILQYNKPYWANPCPDGGHMNYFPVNYECNICWNDHSGLDDDYNFRLHRTDNALYTAGWDGFLQAEFDSDETVDHWDGTGTWWEDFHHHKVDKSDAAARGALDGKFAIVIGEAGIDFEHGCHIELHPIYAMFVHVNDDPNNDQWAFFVRNWGDEGYCGGSQVYYQNTFLDNNEIRIKIPHENATDFTFSANVHSINDHHNKLFLLWDHTPDGMMLDIKLDDPKAHTTMVGDLTIQWKNPNMTLQPRNDASDICSGLGSSTQAITSSTEPSGSSDEEAVNNAISRLDDSSRKELSMKLNDKFPVINTIQPKSINAIKASSAIKVSAPRELKAIDYAKMSYQVEDSLHFIRKNERIGFIKTFLKEKGVKLF
jgi:hypothetical protein